MAKLPISSHALLSSLGGEFSAWLRGNYHECNGSLLGSTLHAPYFRIGGE